MESSKYPLRSQDSTFATGETDLRDSRGSLINTDGCIILSVLSGCATATINSGRHPLHRGDIILLFYDSSISVDRTSRTFRIKYIEFLGCCLRISRLASITPPVRPLVRMVAADRMDCGHT